MPRGPVGPAVLAATAARIELATNSPIDAAIHNVLEPLSGGMSSGARALSGMSSG